MRHQWQPDEHLPLPLYYQVREYLRMAIEKRDGTIVSPDHRVLPEEDLAALLHVSRATARRAILDLVDEGILVRSRSRGTFVVTGTRWEQSLGALESVGEMLASQGVPLSGYVIDSGIVPAPAGKIASLFNEPRLFYLERVRMVDNIPITLDKSYFSERFSPVLATYDLVATNIWQRLALDVALDISYADDRIRATAATPGIARHLGVEPQTSLLGLERAVYDVHQNPIEYTFSFYRSDRYQFHLRRYRNPKAPTDKPEGFSISIERG